MQKQTALLAASLATVALGASAAARADAPTDYYAGKTITILVGSGAGGSYDVYARALANYLGPHIPGNPKFIVKIAGGTGGGIATAVQMDHSVPKDGLTVGIVQQTNITSQILEPEVAGKYDVTKWIWIGNMAPLRNMLGIWYASPAQTIEDAKKQEIVIGATGHNSPTYTVPATLNQLVGTKYRMVVGYTGTTDLNLAMERGEIQGRGGNWISVVIAAPQYIAEKKFTPVVVDGLTRDPGIPDVPTLLEFAKTPDQQAAVRLISASGAFARAFFFPPGVSTDKVTMLRTAFDATIKDPEFLTEAKRLKMEIEPMDGASLDKIARQIIDSPSNGVELAKQLLAAD